MKKVPVLVGAGFGSKHEALKYYYNMWNTQTTKKIISCQVNNADIKPYCMAENPISIRIFLPKLQYFHIL